MALIDGMLQELEEEARTTRRVLERVPDNKLTWRPLEKARTLGELAMHVALVPGAVAELIASPSPAQVPVFTDPTTRSAVSARTRRADPFDLRAERGRESLRMSARGK